MRFYKNATTHPSSMVRRWRTKWVTSIVVLILLFSSLFVSVSLSLLQDTNRVSIYGTISYEEPIIAGTIYFESDNEVDPFKEWRGEVYNSPGGGQIYGDRTSEGPSDADLRQITNPVHSGIYAAEWYVGNPTAQTGYTSQVKGLYWRIDQHEAYYSTWYYFPSDFHGTIGGWCNIMQWKDDSSPYDPTCIVLTKEYEDGTWLIVQQWKPYSWGARIMKLPEGQWFHLQIYYKVGDVDGTVRVWVDGKLVKEFINVDTKGSDPNVMWGIGNYPDASHPPNQSIHTDDTYVTSEYIDPAIWG